MYNSAEGQEVVQIIKLHPVPGAIDQIEFYTTRIVHSFDPTRVGREPQISAGTDRLQTFDAALAEQAVAEKAAAAAADLKRRTAASHDEHRLFEEDKESALSWFAPPAFAAPDSTETAKRSRIPIDLDAYGLVGILLGLAAYNGVLLAPSFPLALYKLFLRAMHADASQNGASPARADLSGLNPDLRDLRALHPTLAASLERLQSYDAATIASLELTFEASRTVPLVVPARGDDDGGGATAGAGGGKEKDAPTRSAAAMKTTTRRITITEELVPNGRNKAVDASNVHEFVAAYTRHLLVDSVFYKQEAMARGFLRVVGSPALALCSPRELESILCGQEELGDFAMLQRSAQYMGGYTASDDVVQWFWEIVLQYPEVWKRRLLQFVTGSDRIPIKGLSAVAFRIQRSGDDDRRLPVAHTCFSTLDLPAYSSKTILETALRVALQFGTEGFGFA